MKKPVEKRTMSKIINYLGKNLCNKTILVYFLNFTWGIIGAVIGFLIFLLLIPFSYIESYNHMIFLRFKKQTVGYVYGFSIGLFSFISNNSWKGLMNHEYGHTVQNAILGPFMIFIVLIPSVIRYHYRNNVRKKGKELKTGYDDIWFEHSATYIGDQTNEK